MALWTPARKGGMSDIEELRAGFAQLFVRFGAAPSDMSFEAAQLGPVAGEWERPVRAHPGRMILYFHGGGFVAGSPETHRGLAGRAAAGRDGDLLCGGQSL